VQLNALMTEHDHIGEALSKLLDNGFLNSPRTIKEIQFILMRNGQYYDETTIEASLQTIVRRGFSLHDAERR
jgi:hypothetical protein